MKQPGWPSLKLIQSDGGRVMHGQTVVSAGMKMLTKPRVILSGMDWCNKKSWNLRQNPVLEKTRKMP